MPPAIGITAAGRQKENNKRGIVHFGESGFLRPTSPDTADRRHDSFWRKTKMQAIAHANPDPTHRSGLALSVHYLAVENLKPDPKNARRHSPKQICQIARSIEAFGFNVPILVDADLNVIGGHGRLLACKRLDGARFRPFGSITSQRRRDGPS
jgi:hypothetical protein